jgi:hypothetical protein
MQRRSLRHRKGNHVQRTDADQLIASFSELAQQIVNIYKTFQIQMESAKAIVNTFPKVHAVSSVNIPHFACAVMMHNEMVQLTLGNHKKIRALVLNPMTWADPNPDSALGVFLAYRENSEPGKLNYAAIKKTIFGYLWLAMEKYEPNSRIIEDDYVVDSDIARGIEEVPEDEAVGQEELEERTLEIGVEDD